MSDSVLAQAGILDKYGCELIGAKLNSINRAEDRQLFRDAMTEIGLATPKSGIATSLETAVQARGSCARKPARVVCA